MTTSALPPIARGSRAKRAHDVSGALSKSQQVLAAVLAVSLGCASQVTARAQEMPQANWTTTDAPCAQYNDLRKPVLGDIGVRIDAAGPWADGFRRALRFWNTVLAANFHEEPNLDSCAVRIVNAGPDILNDAIVARSQLTERDNFNGKIAVSTGAANRMSNAEMYGVAVHELGHILGLKHNASSLSVMYFLNVHGTEVLDRKDILDLSTRHKLRVAAAPRGFLSIEVRSSFAVPMPMPSDSFSSADWWANSPADLDGRMRAGLY
jgi:matrixin